MCLSVVCFVNVLQLVTFSSWHGNQAVQWAVAGLLHPQRRFPSSPRAKLPNKRPHQHQRRQQNGDISVSLRHPLSASLTSQLILICPVCLHPIRIWTHRESKPLTQMVQSSPAIRALHRATTTSRRKGFRCFLTVRQFEQIIAQKLDSSWSLFLNVKPENI